jgi:hypothetical protein
MFLKALKSSLFAFACLGTCTTKAAIFFQNQDDLPQDPGYDFIVAGGKDFTFSCCDILLM